MLLSLDSQLLAFSTRQQQGSTRPWILDRLMLMCALEESSAYGTRRQADLEQFESDGTNNWMRRQFFPEHSHWRIELLSPLRT
jgi:hypothetical protein